MAGVTEIFPDYQTALAACGPGYEASDLIEVIAHKAPFMIDRNLLMPEQAINSITAVSVAAADIETAKPLRVLDFGGGCGFHYVQVAATLSCPLRWAIVETPAMAKRAAEIARGRFGAFDKVGDAAATLGDAPDLVHASGSLPFCPDPIGALKQLVALRSRYLALLRFPVWPHQAIVAVQSSDLEINGFGPMPPHIPNRVVKYPITFPSWHDVINLLKDSYGVLYATDSPSGYYEIAGRGQVVARNFVFRRIK